MVDQRLDRGGVRRLLRVRGGEVVVRHRVRHGHPDGLDIGGVVAVGTADVGVLAVDRGGEELLTRRSAHRTRHRRDDHVVEAEPVEDPDVGVPMRLVGSHEGLVADVERVGVLHHELTATKDAGAWPRLIAVLGLDLVDRQRQVLVRRVQVLHEEGEHLLVRRPQEVVGLFAVLEPEDVVAVLGPTAGRLVGLAGQQRREVDLLRTHRVHLLAHDALDVAQHPVAERKPGVDAGSRPTYVPGPHQQSVARYLSVGRILAKSSEEQARHPQRHKDSFVTHEISDQETICRPQPDFPPTSRERARLTPREGASDRARSESAYSRGPTRLVGGSDAPTRRQRPSTTPRLNAPRLADHLE